MKAAHDGSLTPWHQDWGYWRSQSERPTQLNCMLSIDAADLGNGCIRFVEGSHLQGPVDHARLDSASFGIGLEGDIDRFPATPVETAAGDAVFFGSLVIHGSALNASGRNRRANTFAFDRAGNRIGGERAPRSVPRRQAIAPIMADSSAGIGYRTDTVAMK